jgi:transposase
VDEFGPLNLQPQHGGCWAGRKKRVERLRATYHRHGGVRHFLAAYDLETGRLFGRFTEHKTWQDFLSFLRWLRRRYPKEERLHVVMDNFKPHLKTEVVAWARVHKVTFVLTPTNASWLNRIECQFTALRQFALANSDYTTHEEQQDAIESYLHWRNGKRSISAQAWRPFKPQAA